MQFSAHDIGLDHFASRPFHCWTLEVWDCHYQCMLQFPGDVFEIYKLGENLTNAGKFLHESFQSLEHLLLVFLAPSTVRLRHSHAVALGGWSNPTIAPFVFTQNCLPRAHPELTSKDKSLTMPYRIIVTMCRVLTFLLVKCFILTTCKHWLFIATCYIN